MPYKISDIEVFAGGPDLRYGFWIQDDNGVRIMGLAYTELREAERDNARTEDILRSAVLVLDTTGNDYAKSGLTAWSAKFLSGPDGEGNSLPGFTIKGEDGAVILTLAYWPWRNEARGRKTQVEQLLETSDFVIDGNGKNHSHTSCQWCGGADDPRSGDLLHSK